MKFKIKSKNKITSLMLMLVLVFTLIPIDVLAASNLRLEGTPISTEDQLREIKLDDNSIYYLTNDIHLTGEWTTLPEFRGVLNGNGHKIIGLNITKPNIEIYDGYETRNYGLFSKIISSGEVRNLGIEGTIHISNEEVESEKVYINAGLLAGIISNNYYNTTNSPRVKNISVKGEISLPKNVKNKNVGGLVGIYNLGIADNCYSVVKDFPIIAKGVIPKLSNMYYDENLYRNNNNNSIKGIIGKSTDFIKSNEFVDLLNKNTGDNPKWVLIEGDNPRQEYSDNSEIESCEEIEIYTQEDLSNINSNLSANYKLMKDIELTYENWGLIGSKKDPFSGVLDGNGYKIKNLQYSGSDFDIGLIAYSTGVVKNLGIENSTITAIGWKPDQIGTIVGANYGIIENCYVIDSNITPKFALRSGLIAGRNIEGTIKNSYAVGKGAKYPIATGSGGYDSCFYDRSVFEIEGKERYGVISKSTEEMKKREFVEELNLNRGKDFEWSFVEEDYPALKKSLGEAVESKPNEESIENNDKITNELRKNIIESIKDTTDPWAIMSIVANGNENDLTNIKKFKKEAYVNIQNSIGKSATTIERYIIGLSAISKNAEKLTDDMDKLNAIEALSITNISLINSTIFALIAYDSGSYKIPSNANYTREDLINIIINKQTEKGGWALVGRGEDTDITSMAISALAPYYIAEDFKTAEISEETYNNVKISVDKAITLLSDIKLDDGSYSSDSKALNSNSNSTAMVIIAMSSVGIDVQRDSRFIKGGKNPIDGLLKFKTNDNNGFGFKNNQYNGMSTEQGLRAIVSYNNYNKNKEAYNIYTFNKGFVDKTEPPVKPESNEKPVLYGVKDKEIKLGDEFDPKYGVTANDKEDGDLTAKIIVYGKVDVTRAGNYNLKYEVVDSNGNVSIKEITISVVDELVQEGKISVGIYTDEKNIYESIKVDYKKDDTAYTVIQRLLGDKVIATGNKESLYVKSIDGVAEFDKGIMSGWVYAVNKVKPSVSAGSYKVKPGDELIWHYTIDLGEDIDNSYIKFDKFKITQNEEDKPSNENEAPIIIASNLKVYIGQIFEPLKYVLASDKEDGDLSSKIKVVKNTVNINKIGEYEVVYEVTDSNEVSTRRTIIVTIIENMDVLLGKLDASNWILNQLKNPVYGEEWKIFGIVRGDIKLSENIKNNYYSNLVKVLKEKNGILHRYKYTEYSRIIITLTALGYDPTNVGGYNLVEKLYNYDEVSKQGINGEIFALIALDTKNFEIKGGKNSREMLIDGITSKQLPDGGFNLSGSNGDVDITAMAIQALAKYKDKSNVKESINRALNFLSRSQLVSGGFGTSEGETVESNAQVLIALSSLGINIDDERFVKNGLNLLDAIMKFKADDGGFKHLLMQDNSNAMATEQTLMALSSYVRLINGKTNIYDMSDVIVNSEDNPSEEKNPDLDNESNTNNSESTSTSDSNNINENKESINNPEAGDKSNLIYLIVAMIALLGGSIINKKKTS